MAENERRKRAEAAANTIEATEAKEEDEEESTPSPEAQIQTTQPKKSSEPIGEWAWISIEILIFVINILNFHLNKHF